MSLYVMIESPLPVNLAPYDITSFHVAPTREALKTISPLLLDIRKKGDIPRIDITYSLAPFQRSDGVDISWPEAKAMGLSPRTISDIPPTSVETNEFHRYRVISWFTNTFLPSYESANANTLIVADSDTIKWITDYLDEKSEAAPIQHDLRQRISLGAIFKYTPNVFGFRAHGFEYSFSQ